MAFNLDPESAGGPFELAIQGKNSIVIHDVLVGEVWLCSGQSNMEFQLKSVRNADSEISTAGYPEIRQIKIPLTVSSNPKEDIPPANWNVCSSKDGGKFYRRRLFFCEGNRKALTCSRWIDQFDLGRNHGRNLDQP